MPVVKNFTSISPIPKRIILTYKTDDPAKFPEKYMKGYNSILKYFSANYEIKLFVDEEMDQVVRNFDIKLFELYNTKSIIVKTDIFRIIALYIYGGYYMDLDVFWENDPTKYLDSITNDVVFCVEKTLFPQCVMLYLNDKNNNIFSLSNYFMGCTQKNNYFEKMIEQLYISIDTKKIFLTHNTFWIKNTINKYSIYKHNNNIEYIFKIYDKMIVNSVSIDSKQTNDPNVIEYASVLMDAGPLFISHFYNSNQCKHLKDKVFIIKTKKDGYIGDYGLHLHEAGWNV
tara:strand:+ start:861 stop:1715 length:855 start_codon:yes stop_codon:yes gene_type:complete